MIPQYQNINYQQFRNVLAQQQPQFFKLVFFYTSTCGVCKPILPQLDSIGGRLGAGEAGFPTQLSVVLIDAYAQDLSSNVGFGTVPTFVLYGQGPNPQIIAGHEGPMNEPQVIPWVRQNLASLGA